jgi:hypothetical protein
VDVGFALVSGRLVVLVLVAAALTLDLVIFAQKMLFESFAFVDAVFPPVVPAGVFVFGVSHGSLLIARCGQSTHGL